MNGQSPAHSEGVLAAKNALTLGTSLALTAGMALVVRLLIPRFLGPAAFGELRLAESFAEMLFVILTFGVDMQLRREAAVDASKARQYLAGLTALRAVVGAAAIAAMVLVLKAIGSSDRVVVLFVLVSLYQILLVLNNSYAALEHASGHVSWLARTSFGMKVVWGLAVAAVLAQLASALAIVTVTLVIEAARFAWFTARAVKHHQLATRPDTKLAWAAILASLPFFVNSLAHTLYARIGTGWLAAVSNDVEVGLYSAAGSFAAVALLGMPLLSWVLVPSTARAAAISDAERDRLVAGALRLSLLLGVPLAAACHLGAGQLVAWLLGPEYAAAAPVLRMMAPTVGLAYISTVCAIALIQRGATWTVAAVSLAGVAVTVALDAALIPWGARTLGAAGAAQGAALAALGTEIAVTIALVALSRSSLRDRSLLRTAGALAGGLAAVALTARLAPQPGAGAFVVAGIAFAMTVVAAGGVNRDDLAFCRRVLTRSRRVAPPVLVPEVS